MTKSLLVSLIFLFSFSLNAQTVVIAADKMNVFYLGVDNPVAVAVESVLNEKLKISTDNGVIIKTEKNDFIVRPERTGIGNIIIEWDGQKVLKPFRVKRIPDPVVKLINKKSYFIEETPINGLIADLENFDFDAICRIVSYTCSVVAENGESRQAKVNGPTSSELSRILSNVKKGDKVIFSGISVRCPGDKVPRLLSESIIRIIK